jgi:hypothetical protein
MKLHTLLFTVMIMFSFASYASQPMKVDDPAPRSKVVFSDESKQVHVAPADTLLFRHVADENGRSYNQPADLLRTVFRTRIASPAFVTASLAPPTGPLGPDNPAASGFAAVRPPPWPLGPDNPAIEGRHQLQFAKKA